MGLDIRLPIGAMFTVFGLVLVVYGIASDKAIYKRSLGININLVWGAVLLVFGVVMLVLGRRNASKARTGDNRALQQPCRSKLKETTAQLDSE